MKVTAVVVGLSVSERHIIVAVISARRSPHRAGWSARSPASPRGSARQDRALAPPIRFRADSREKVKPHGAFRDSPSGATTMRSSVAPRGILTDSMGNALRQPTPPRIRGKAELQAQESPQVGAPWQAQSRTPRHRLSDGSRVRLWPPCAESVGDYQKGAPNPPQRAGSARRESHGR